MATDAQRIAAFEAELTRLSEEVAKLAGIREALSRYTANQSAAHYLIEMGRQIERDAQTQRCHEPITVCTWRWWRSSEAGKVLIAGHFRCDQHHIEVGPPPGRPSASVRRASR